MGTVDAQSVARSVADVRHRIERLAGGRKVELIAITKGFGFDAIEAASLARCTSIGESYAQELHEKLRSVPPGFCVPQVHFVGRLQTNKIKGLAPVVTVWQSVDRAEVARELCRHAPNASIFVQVNTTDESSKGGSPPAATGQLVAYCRSLDFDVRGLMTVGPTSGEMSLTRTAFALLRRMADDLGIDGCSMGMTSDFEVAVEQGSTHVRIGSALFGERPLRPAQMR